MHQNLSGASPLDSVHYFLVESAIRQLITSSLTEKAQTSTADFTVCNSYWAGLYLEGRSGIQKIWPYIWLTLASPLEENGTVTWVGSGNMKQRTLIVASHPSWSLFWWCSSVTVHKLSKQICEMEWYLLSETKSINTLSCGCNQFRILRYSTVSDWMCGGQESKKLIFHRNFNSNNRNACTLNKGKFDWNYFLTSTVFI